MSSKQTCREVAAVPPDKLPQRLSLFFADMACKVFDESGATNTAPDEARVRDELVTPLQWMLCGRDPTVAFCSLEEHQTQANFCGKVFRGGEPAYFCKWVCVGWWAWIRITSRSPSCNLRLPLSVAQSTVFTSVLEYYYKN